MDSSGRSSHAKKKAKREASPPSGKEIFMSLLRGVYLGVVLLTSLPATAMVPGVFSQVDVKKYLAKIPDGLVDDDKSLALSRALLSATNDDADPDKGRSALYTDHELIEGITKTIAHKQYKQADAWKEYGIPERVMQRKLADVRERLVKLGHPSIKNQSDLRVLYKTKGGPDVIAKAMENACIEKKVGGRQQFLSPSEKHLIAFESDSLSNSGENCSRKRMAAEASAVVKANGERELAAAIVSGDVRAQKRARRMVDNKIERKFVMQRLVRDIKNDMPEVKPTFVGASAVNAKRLAAGDVAKSHLFSVMVANGLNKLKAEGIILNFPEADQVYLYITLFSHNHDISYPHSQ